MEPLEIFQPTISLEINYFIYSFKDSLKNDYYTYRCKYRSKCGVILKISRTELINIKKERLSLKYNLNLQAKLKTIHV